MVLHRAKNHCYMCAGGLYGPCLTCVSYDTISLCLPNPAKVLSNSQSEALCCLVDRGSTASSRPSRNLSHGGDWRVDCCMSCKKSSGAVHHTVKQDRLQNTWEISENGQIMIRIQRLSLVLSSPRSFANAQASYAQVQAFACETSNLHHLWASWNVPWLFQRATSLNYLVDLAIFGG